MYVKRPQSFCIKLSLSAKIEMKVKMRHRKICKRKYGRERKRIMRKNRRDSIRKERIIMVASSAFVLAALTMTGLYMRGQEAKQQDDGYTLDFAALENNGDDKLQEIEQQQAKNTAVGGNTELSTDNDLDYMPLEENLSEEAGSHLVEIPGLTDGVEKEAKKPESGQQEEVPEEKPAESPEEDSRQTTAELHYNEEQGLTRPVDGDILMPYSMDGGIYFATLDQYKYNPATMFAAQEGADVVSCAEGRVTRVFEDAELGHALSIELGDGYVATYGQLANIEVEKDSRVKPGDKIGTVAAPSKYYSLEGTNLYFKLEKDGKPVNAENLF